MGSKWTGQNTYYDTGTVKYHLLKFKLNKSLKPGDKFKIAVKKVENKNLYTYFTATAKSSIKKFTIGSKAVFKVENNGTSTNPKYAGTSKNPFKIVLSSDKYNFNNAVYVRTVDMKGNIYKNVKMHVVLINMEGSQLNFDITTDSQGIAKLSPTYKDIYQLLIKDARDYFLRYNPNTTEEEYVEVSSMEFTMADNKYYFGDIYSSNDRFLKGFYWNQKYLPAFFVLLVTPNPSN